jgi:hypothetical protein
MYVKRINPSMKSHAPKYNAPIKINVDLIIRSPFYFVSCGSVCDYCNRFSGAAAAGAKLALSAGHAPVVFFACGA